ncbi:hypothetical protein RHSIM_Rhsim03G0169900 [Rhododendron simsii]|uniref:Small ribosomal subunit protein uS10 domain-containing protein n=1 Tax=Rhododendron simsii TaxID=118357 RepID=A0A834H897_RHOSS|nr:hypothetical protein RHSIM_Rhsim03G0169900 [Rhododendron simsii]
MGRPGWPLVAFSTASTDRNRIVLTDLSTNAAAVSSVFSAAAALTVAARDPSPFRPATTAEQREMEPGLDPDRARRLDCWWVEMGVQQNFEVCADLVRGAKDKRLRVKGPVRMPTKVLHITTRKALAVKDGRDALPFLPTIFLTCFKRCLFHFCTPSSWTVPKSIGLCTFVHFPYACHPKGTNTWDRVELHVHKRVIDLFSSPDVVKQITSITIEPGVEIEVTIADS